LAALSSVNCADASGAAAPTNSATCVGYRCSRPPTTVNKMRNASLSLWCGQISLRDQFQDWRSGIALQTGAPDRSCPWDGRIGPMLAPRAPRDCRK
jgi:hypothetical protein